MTARYGAIAILDLAWIVLAMTVGLGAGAALLGHAVAVIGTYALWLRQDPHGGFAAALLGLMGPPGLMLGQWLGAGAERWRIVPPASDDDIPMLGRRPGIRRRGAAREVARLLDGRIQYPQSSGLDSLVTILRHGAVAERRRALETVVRSFEPGLSPLIAQVLNDPDQTIRALAAAASARIVQNLAEQRAGLEAKVVAGDDEAREALARLLADHGRANLLLSDTQRGHMRTEAAALFACGNQADEAERLALEAAWTARDYAAIDRMRATRDDDDSRWWRAEVAR
ncbi:hypothetical protein RN629_12020 [Sphingomonadaceae bacterium jetA1]|jgi:hypothetical protein|uniref:hypothetical protein n=1 Tax=Facivitalis istanbulensis TaxID=3075838 RepID=UPI00348745AA